ncbi:MAG: 30S ribosomal protein S16 [Actinomycetota bacterium]
MTTRIRLRRLGANKRPFYRVVVADQRSPRDGRFIENIGRYHPLDEPSRIEIDEARALHWLRTGAQPSETVRNLMDKVGIWPKFVAERPEAGKPRGGERARKRPPRVGAKAAAAAEAAAASAAKAEAEAAKAAAAAEAAAAEAATAEAAEAAPVEEPQVEAPAAETSADEPQPEA